MRARASGPPTDRRAFVMLSVLWAIALIGALAVGAALSGRDAFDAGRNRLNATHAVWLATACVERARAAIDSALRVTSDRPSMTWRHLDTAIAHEPLVQESGCDIALEAAGTRRDVNDASPLELTRLFTHLGREDASALAAAITDWRDEDGDALPDGAEAGWYATRGRALPRNSALAHEEELRRVRGLEDGDGPQYLTVEEGHISIPNASEAVLASIVGFTDETVAEVLAQRARGTDVEDLLGLASEVSVASRDSLVAHFQDISRRTTLDPDAWIVTGRGRFGTPAALAQVQMRLVRTDRRAIVTRRRVSA